MKPIAELSMIATESHMEHATGIDFRRLFGRRPRVIIGHSFFGRGGSEACAMWLCQALKQDCDLTIMTTGGWDLDDLNQYYGSSLEPGEVRVRFAPMPPLPRAVMAAALRGNVYQRFARRIAGEYDIRISAYNATDWGLPAIHFLADFSWHRGLREQFHPPAPGIFYRDSMLRKFYLGLSAAFGKPSGRDVLHADSVIANSRWSAEQIKQACGVTCGAVVYPPVWTDFPVVPWNEKEAAFAMIGRVAPEKRIEEAIAILEGVRARGHANSAPSVRRNRRRPLRAPHCATLPPAQRLDCCRRASERRQEGADSDSLPLWNPNLQRGGFWHHRGRDGESRSHSIRSRHRWTGGDP